MCACARSTVCVSALSVYSQAHWSVYMHVCSASWDAQAKIYLFVICEVSHSSWSFWSPQERAGFRCLINCLSAMEEECEKSMSLASFVK